MARCHTPLPLEGLTPVGPGTATEQTEDEDVHDEEDVRDYEDAEVLETPSFLASEAAEASEAAKAARDAALACVGEDVERGNHDVALHCDGRTDLGTGHQ